MLSKLLKHEFRATGRVMLPLFAAVLAISALSNLAVRYLDFSDNWFFQTLSVVIIVLFVVGIISLGIVAVVLSVNRFRQSVLGDEGYLTLTLPVSIHSVVWSKIIVSAVWFILCGLVIFASVYILTLDVVLIHNTVSFMSDLFKFLFGNFNVDKASLILISIEAFIDICLASCIAALTFYAALSTGHGFASHKMLISVIAFFVFAIIMNVLTTAGINIIDHSNLTHYTHDMDMIGAGHTTFIGLFIYLIIEGAIYYAITVYNLKHRLNLE